MRSAPVLARRKGSTTSFRPASPMTRPKTRWLRSTRVRGDLAAGQPMDRLVCGDVGFGKTEVALRAAFIAAMNGKQVAVVVPTTLLARQHFKTFTERLRGYPVRIAQASRLVGAKELALTKGNLLRRQDRHRGRHPCAAWLVDPVRKSRAADHRRGAAFRRQAQGAAEGAQIRRACADADSATPIPRTCNWP
jgi:hypothetical protein